MKIIAGIKKRKVKTFFVVTIFTGLCMVVFYFVKIIPYLSIEPITNEDLDTLHLEGYNKLMIVAHPDDEMLWGGAHLLEDDYLVVCITNRDNEIRKAEFEAVMDKSGSIGVIMSYPDVIAHKKSKWTFWRDSILQDLETIINYKDWELIVTHNENGEYGHIHHIMTHELVEVSYHDTNSTAKLYYFGEYYKADDIPDDLQQISESSLDDKIRILKEYENQIKVINGFDHMFPYELWIEG